MGIDENSFPTTSANVVLVELGKQGVVNGNPRIKVDLGQTSIRKTNFSAEGKREWSKLSMETQDKRPILYEKCLAKLRPKNESFH